MIAKVLVGTDGSTTARIAVARRRRGGGQRRCGADDPRPPDADGEQVAREAAAQHDASDLTIVALGAGGDPADALVNEARRGGYDLLVTGNKGLTGLRRLSPTDRTPGKVAHHLPCSLLVVKTT